MSGIVFILGAGASQVTGVPLMAEFLDVASELRQKGRIDKTREFDSVSKGISQLQGVHSKAQLDLKNVESVFAAFEMAQTLGEFGVGYKRQDIEELVHAMRTVITETIQATMSIPVSNQNIQPLVPYGDFIELIRDLANSRTREWRPSIITFNYDLAIDFTVYKQATSIDYWLDDDHGGALPLLKLHGSLNWARCKSCNRVVPWMLSEYSKQCGWGDVVRSPVTKWLHLNTGSHLTEFKHCGGEVHPDPVIVPPTWNKFKYTDDLAAVWAGAARQLSEAEDIIVIGYSLPTTDEFFRYLYALGSVGPKPLKRFWVINPDTSGHTKERFQGLLGPGALQRFAYHPLTFEQAIPVLRKALLPPDER